MKHLLLSILLSSVLACGNKSTPPPSEPEPAEPATAEPGTTPAPTSTPTTGEECEAAGFTVVGDIGDGQVRCPDGMEEVSRIQYGIEGGVCCKPATGAPPTTTDQTPPM